MVKSKYNMLNLQITFQLFQAWPEELLRELKNTSSF